MTRMLKPLKGRILVRANEPPETTASGLIYIPEKARQKTQRGVIVAKHPDFTDAEIGDEVFLTRWAEGRHTTFQHNGEDVLMLKDKDDILAIIER